MPTGYTAEIKDGITFNQYALRCARAFGALITMRDEPTDTEIPNEFLPSDYHVGEIDKAKSELLAVESLSDLECEQKSVAEYNEQVKYNKKRTQESIDLGNKYDEMLSQCINYVAPTADHVGYREFMINQIIESKEFDCSYSHYEEPKKVGGYEWRAEKIEMLKKSIEYHNKEYAQEIERCNNRTAWVQALKKSLHQ